MSSYFGLPWSPDLGDLDFWRETSATGSPVTFRLPPNRRSQIMSQLKRRGMQPAVMIANLQRAIDVEAAAISEQTQPGLAYFDYDIYHPLNEINNWMLYMAANFPHLVSLINVTTSYEGRNIMAIKVITSTAGSQSGTAKPGFLLTGGMHAREWVSPATVVYMAGQLIEQYEVDEQITAMVEAMDWYIVPVVNPDGYVYSWTTDRLWRKTRSRRSGHCVGVDPNRNFNWKWCQKGASRNPCRSDYCGPFAFSETEVKGVADFMKAVPGRFQAYVDVHAYSQMWLLPWAYTRTLSNSHKRLDDCATAGVRALTAVHGTRFRKGTVARILYTVSGSGMDWAHGAIKIPYVAGLELRDRGNHGFLLPADQIIPTGEETLQGILAMAEHILVNP
ncbi:carboxypeptidase B-like [Liolophura sinensis]|uniref:carboxypeptidase B-like n=1 Tax=Liolophura sinensis TaxID=3198878 RepID=UPI0031590953